LGFKNEAGDRWQNGTKQGPQKSPTLNYESLLARECHVPIGDFAKRGLVFFQLTRFTI